MTIKGFLYPFARECYSFIMIYLIGGSPRSGKTTLAKRLARRLRVGWVSVDTLEGIVREYTPRKELAKLFPKNVLRKKTNGRNDEMYTRYSDQEIVDAYIRQGKTSWKAIDAFVADCINESHDFILEGHQIHPQLIANLKKYYPKNIQAIVLVKRDEALLIEGFEKNTAKSDWVVQKTKDKKIYIKIARMLSCFGERIEKEAKKVHVPVHRTDVQFLKTLATIEKTLGKRQIVS